MTASAIGISELFSAQQLRSQDDGRLTPTTSYLAEVLRASASALFDASYSAAQGEDVSSISGRRVRSMAADRLRPVFPIAENSAAAFLGDAEATADFGAPDIRAAYDALIEIGDLIEISGGRIYPSRLRAIRFDVDLCGLISGCSSEELRLSESRWHSRSLLRMVNRSPAHAIEQSLSNWVGVRHLDYARYAREQLARPLHSMREDASEWRIANVTGTTTEWIEATKWSEFSRPLLVRRRRDENSPWERFVARLKPATRGVECVGGRLLTYFDCSRILHGEKMAKGFGRRLWTASLPSGSEVLCDTHELPEVRRALLAFSYDFIESNDRIRFSISSELRAALESVLGRIGFKLGPPR